jgi:hypothetical protein
MIRMSATGVTVAQTLAAAAANHTTPLVPSCSFWTPTLRAATPDATQDVPALVLSGAVASPSVATVSPFGNVVSGGSTSQTVTLNNTGAGILLINSVTATGDYSIQSNNCITSLAANSSCILSVKFTPSAEGTRTGTLSFSDWAKSSPQAVSLSGAGVLNGTVQLITTSALSKIAGGYQAVVTVANNGTGTAQNVQLTSAALGAASGTTIPASLGNIAHGGGTASVTLTFPSSAGADAAPVVLKLAGAYTGGTFGGSTRAVLP